MSALNYHWLDELPTEILENEKEIDFLIRLNMQTHVCNEREAILKRMVEH